MIYMFLANGFEEVEALCPLDILRRAGLDVPQSAALVHSLRELGFAMDGKVGTPEDCAQTILGALNQ